MSITKIKKKRKGGDEYDRLYFDLNVGYNKV